MQKNYAGMAEVTSGDHVSLSLKISPLSKVVFLADFDGGIASITQGHAGSDSDYDITKSEGGKGLRLINGKFGDILLYGASKRDDISGEWAPLPLKEGQMMTLKTPGRPDMDIELKLNYLVI